MGLDRTQLMATQMSQKKGQSQQQAAELGGQQPLIMPIIVNAGDGHVSGGHQSSGGVDLGDAHKLKDMISQAVSDQFQLHKIRKDNGFEQPN